jgi:hypothetical protein
VIALRRAHCGPYPKWSLAATSPPAAMSTSTTRAKPLRDAAMSAVNLQHSRLQHATACCRSCQFCPVVLVAGCHDVGARRDEQLDRACVAVVRRRDEHTTISGGVPRLRPVHGPYPWLVLAATSAPAAMSTSTTCVWPWYPAIMSAVTLQHSRLQHPTGACCRFVSVLPDVARGCQLLDVGAGRDEQLDHALVSITRCQH